jgi:hypothetical protein
MVLKSTHTYAILELSKLAFEEIKKKLEEAGYQDQINDEASSSEYPCIIDMHGIAVAPEKGEGCG